MQRDVGALQGSLRRPPSEALAASPSALLDSLAEPLAFLTVAVLFRDNDLFFFRALALLICVRAVFSEVPRLLVRVCGIRVGRAVAADDFCLLGWVKGLSVGLTVS